MALRKEQTVLIVAVLALAWLGWRSWDESGGRGSSTRRATPPALPQHPAPDTRLVLPAARDAGEDRSRELFSPPSDTHPLPPLEMDALPLVALPALRPPSMPGPAPRLYGRYLRVAPAPLEVPDLFAGEGAVEGAGEGGAGGERADAGAGAAATPASETTPQEKAERIAGYKRLYDWIRITDFRFGQIRNPERYSLARRPGEDVLFVEVNPATGLARIPGQAPAPIPRATIAEFGFADTVQNQIEMRRAELGDPLSASDYDPALIFAEWCIEQRLETPRALQVAEEMFRRALPLLTEDPSPHLGLARCYEAGFRFEEAAREYQSMMAGNWGRDPLVLARLAQLEARFRLFARAEERLLEAERYGRARWQVQWALGKFLLDRGRATEAAPHLRLACQNEPSGPEHKSSRARMRCDLGAALLHLGETAEAEQWFDKARQADPAEQAALAGLLCVDATTGAGAKPGINGSGSAAARGGPGGTGSPGGLPGEELSSVRFDLLLATGVEALAHRDAASARRARQSLLLAAAADPLRAGLAWRALSYLAEITGHPEEAQRFAEQAYENDPTDAWTLYQRGRILAARDDLDGAMDSFRRALDQELDLPDALAAIGELAHRRGDFPAAERYLERALALDPALTPVTALRGVNFLALGDLRAAEDTFRKALAAEQDQPTARNGLAWCFYRKGDPEEALGRLVDLDDNRRTQPESDPHRVWAKNQIARLQDHLEKVVWTDRFERRTILNGWDLEERNGPLCSIHDGMVTLEGAFKQNGRARLWQTKGAGVFVAFQARVTIRSGTTARVGISVSREMARLGETQLESEVTITRHHEPGKNTIQTRVMKRGEEDLPYTDVQGFEWKLDTPVVLRIERTGDSSDTRVRLVVDGFPVLDDKPMPNLGRTTAELRLSIFAEGQTGRQVKVDVDDVEIVFRDKR